MPGKKNKQLINLTSYYLLCMPELAPIAKFPERLACQMSSEGIRASMLFSDYILNWHYEAGTLLRYLEIFTVMFLKTAKY